MATLTATLHRTALALILLDLLFSPQIAPSTEAQTQPHAPLGTNLARYRIWDGMRGLDYLTSLPEVDPARIGCVGNSGGGTLTAYLAALDPRVTVAAICCYITTLRRRMGNRIQEDPSADPEQDIFGFVGEGIDHAGLLALRVCRRVWLARIRLIGLSRRAAGLTLALARLSGLLRVPGNLIGHRGNSITPMIYVSA